MRTHLSSSSGLDGMPLTFDAFRECSVLGLICFDKWVRLSALHMIELQQELHTQTPGPDIPRGEDLPTGILARVGGGSHHACLEKPFDTGGHGEMATGALQRR